MDWAMGRLGVHALAEEAKILHLLAHEATGEADLLASDHHHLLTIEQLLGQYRSQSPQHVVAGVNNHSPRADSRP